MPARFSALLDKKWVRRFVYVNPVAFSKRVRRVGDPLKFSAIPPACGSVIFTKNVCSRCNALSPQYELENAIAEVTIMKGGARMMLGKTAAPFASKLIDAHEREKKNLFYPLLSSCRMTNIFFFIRNM